MDPIENLTEYFRKFPGIGPRQARRFVYHLLTQSKEQIDGLLASVQNVRKSISVCPSCFRYFTAPDHLKDATGALCTVCGNSARDRELLMVVARDIDFQAVEKSRAYNGLYFVLGGTVPILDDAPHLHIRQTELLQTIVSRPTLKEVIVATNVNPEGEHTALYISTLLKKETTVPKVTTLGRGFSTGTEIEYSDTDTIKSALENRRGV